MLDGDDKDVEGRNSRALSIGAGLELVSFLGLFSGRLMDGIGRSPFPSPNFDIRWDGLEAASGEE